MKSDVDTAAPHHALRAAAEPLRWRILALLGREEMCVCHLVEALDAPQSLISHHLRVMRDAGLLESERYRYWTYYRLRRGTLADLGQTLIDLAAGAPAPGTTRRPCC
ncbi:MAG TPA: metalloregulator ArsR/SmtB family transcription factor [Acidimicrobiia bacterium]|jgi:ArsR family transcriptional regulator|nr:metalloregulator ArsR/SmtB family transcription factor [Acidimicrobiia bacterium]